MKRDAAPKTAGDSSGGFNNMPGTDRRKRGRNSYVYGQLVADYDGQSMPLKSDFYSVTFLNLSRMGAAFLSPRKPSTDQLVIVLGKSQVYVIAQVVRTFYRTDIGDPVFEVGCEFVRRLS